MAVNFYLKIDGIDGESSIANHTKEMEILSWNHGFSQPTSPIRSSSGSGTVEKANHSAISFSKYIDSSIADLLKNCWNGKTIATAELTCLNADADSNSDGGVYLTISMTEVIISSYNVSGGGGGFPIENFTFTYGSVKYNYVPFKPADGTGSGNKPATHNLITGAVS